jgi:2-polyprenyl-3-methyl-5-hydroxy-6-metoxy-1,4-benzoquinol methylase
VVEERTGPGAEVSVFAWHHARYELAAQRVSGRRVLDLGSGEGYGAALMASKAAVVVGVDADLPTLERARRSYPLGNLTFEHGDVTEFESGSRKFDVVTCFEVLEHVADAAALFKVIAGVLDPGGELLLSTPNRLVEEPFEHVWGHQNHYHINLMSARELQALASRHFATVTITGQSVRGNLLHTALKTADVFNLRHRVVRSLGAQRRMEAVMGKQELQAHHALNAFRFSPWLKRQSPALILRASGPRRR